MRPLFHPPIEDVTVESILHALSDPVRVAIFADIATANCAFNCSNFLNVSERPIPKSTLSHHFKALREAGLIRAERVSQSPSGIDTPHRLATNPAAIRSDDQVCHRFTLGHSGDGGYFETLHPQQPQPPHF